MAEILGWMDGTDLQVEVTVCGRSALLEPSGAAL